MMFSGAKLRFYRYRSGRTQDELARAVGVTSAYLSNVEHGKRVPSPSLMEELARALSVKVEDLWDSDAVIPKDEADRGIILEYNRGEDRLRLVLPPTPRSYALAADKAAEWDRPFSADLRRVIEAWDALSGSARKKILSICEEVAGLKSDSSAARVIKCSHDGGE